MISLCTGVRRAAVRKLEHELGIVDLHPSDFHYLTKIRYQAASCEQWGECEGKRKNNLMSRHLFHIFHIISGLYFIRTD